MLNKNCVLVAGCFGYIGNALTQRLLMEGYKVVGIDNNVREYNVREMGSYSAVEQSNLLRRTILFKNIGEFEHYNFDISSYSSYQVISNIIERHRPCTIVNLAHQPSGPYSMIDNVHANYSLTNNIIGSSNFLWAIKETYPDIHYTTIGTTGEYDHYSNIDIEEGYFKINYKGRESNELIYPRKPTSIYHSSKVASLYLNEYLTRIWNLRTTEAEQAVVFGLYTKETDDTKIYSRLDTDGCFGTVLNKFIVQAMLGIPLTIFGEGKHQRGFLALQNSVDAVMLSIENPPKRGKLRIFNQLSETWSINELANKVKEYAKKTKNIDVKFNYIESPRKEYTGDHYYKYISEILPAMGYVPTRTVEDEIEYIFNTLDLQYISDLKDTITENIEF